MIRKYMYALMYCLFLHWLVLILNIFRYMAYLLKIFSHLDLQETSFKEDVIMNQSVKIPVNSY